MSASVLVRLCSGRRRRPWRPSWISSLPTWSWRFSFRTGRFYWRPSPTATRPPSRATVSPPCPPWRPPPQWSPRPTSRPRPRPTARPPPWCRPSSSRGRRFRPSSPTPRPRPAITGPATPPGREHCGAGRGEEGEGEVSLPASRPPPGPGPVWAAAWATWAASPPSPARPPECPGTELTRPQAALPSSNTPARSQPASWAVRPVSSVKLVSLVRSVRSVRAVRRPPGTTAVRPPGAAGAAAPALLTVWPAGAARRPGDTAWPPSTQVRHSGTQAESS